MNAVISLLLLSTSTTFSNDVDVSVSRLTLDLANNLLRPGENFFISPLCIQSALTMTYLGASENTARQISKAMHIDHSIHEKHKELLQRYIGPQENYTAILARKFFIRPDFVIDDRFNGALQHYYNTSIETLNFVGNSTSSATTINDWIKQTTQNTITGLFDSHSFNAETALVLLNVIYFRGVWTIPFDPKLSLKDKFTLEDGTATMTTFMNMKHQTFNYVDLVNLRASAMEMTYYGSNMKMIILLPYENVKIADILPSLTPETLTNINKQMKPVPLKVKIPKYGMQTKYTNELVNALRKLGIDDLFSSQTANLSGISPTLGLYVSLIEHQASINIDETGSQSSAATGMVIGGFSLPKNVELNRPFLFWILDSDTNLVLFFGAYYKP